eukprot:TRINITY_DN17283_c0_g1_i1.p2 TRINITY_DN17283_c0_g1~~TRINITY_DN17283_c0_g1_i1.p2  ORF type:complete len:190 (+),score=30.66 TRINITY_DN17283_c0_g1_i1:279-848(+)
MQRLANKLKAGKEDLLDILRKRLKNAEMIKKSKKKRRLVISNELKAKKALVSTIRNDINLSLASELNAISKKFSDPSFKKVFATMLHERSKKAFVNAVVAILNEADSIDDTIINLENVEELYVKLVNFKSPSASYNVARQGFELSAEFNTEQGNIKDNNYALLAKWLQVTTDIIPVSYTHLTLPTICSV